MLAYFVAFFFLRFIGGLVVLVGILLSIILGIKGYMDFTITKHVYFNPSSNSLEIQEISPRSIKAKTIPLHEIKTVEIFPLDRKGRKHRLSIILRNNKKIKFNLDQWADQCSAVERMRNMGLLVMAPLCEGGTINTRASAGMRDAGEREGVLGIIRKYHREMKTLDRFFIITYIIGGAFLGLLFTAIPILGIILGIIYWIIYFLILIAIVFEHVKNPVYQIIIIFMSIFLIIGAIMIAIWLHLYLHW